jgi:hypothetical protein
LDDAISAAVPKAAFLHRVEIMVHPLRQARGAFGEVRREARKAVAHDRPRSATGTSPIAAFEGCSADQAQLHRDAVTQVTMGERSLA